MNRRAVRLFFILLGGYIALVCAAWFGLGPDNLDRSALGVILLLPFFSVYLFHGLGMPWMLEHNGHCGWGWCAPTWFGLAFTALFWLVLLALLSMALTREPAQQEERKHD